MKLFPACLNSLASPSGGNVSGGVPICFNVTSASAPKRCKDLLDRAQFRALREWNSRCAQARKDRPSDRSALVAGQVVHNHQVAGRQGRGRELLNIDAEDAICVRYAEDERHINPVDAQHGMKVMMSSGHVVPARTGAAPRPRRGAL